MLLGQEDHAHAVLAGRGQGDALVGHVGAVVLVRDLDQDAGAVAHQLVGTHGAAVIQVLEDLECTLHDFMGLVALDVRHETHAAGVVLVRTVVQTVFLQMLDLGSRGHGALLNIHRGRKHSAAQQHFQEK